MIFQFDGSKFLESFSPNYDRLSNYVKTVVLPDGRVAQMQIVITTDENDFCMKPDTMNAIIAKPCKPGDHSL